MGELKRISFVTGVTSIIEGEMVTRKMYALYFQVPSGRLEDEAPQYDSLAGRRGSFNEGPSDELRPERRTIIALECLIDLRGACVTQEVHIETCVV